jgi:hypothetical protein
LILQKLFSLLVRATALCTLTAQAFSQPSPPPDAVLFPLSHPSPLFAFSLFFFLPSHPAAVGTEMNESNAAMLASAEAIKMVSDALNEIKKEAKLMSFEHVREIYLVEDEFTVEDGLVTPTFKLKRPQLKDRFQKQIDDMYAENKKKNAHRE